MTAWPDLVNGGFELVGGVSAWMNVRALYRSRFVSGVDRRAMCFYAAWGLWNLFYYPSLDQWASFAGGVFITAGTITWAVLAFGWRREPANA